MKSIIVSCENNVILIILSLFIWRWNSQSNKLEERESSIWRLWITSQYGLLRLCSVLPLFGNGVLSFNEKRLLNRLNWNIKPCFLALTNAQLRVFGGQWHFLESQFQTDTYYTTIDAPDVDIWSMSSNFSFIHLWNH